MPAVFLRTEDLLLDGLAPYPGNARRGDQAAITESLALFGQYRSLAVRVLPDGSHVIMAGNHTAQGIRDLLAMTRAQLERAYGQEAADRWYGAPRTARCDLTECDDATARKINLADNRLADLGTYDDISLTDLLQGLDGDYAGTGWADEDLGALLDRGGPRGGLSDEDDAPPAPKVAISQPGDLWLLGPHRMIVGDCTDHDTVQLLVAGDSLADLMWTDPPYGVNYQEFTTPQKASAAHRRTDGLTVSGDSIEDLPQLLDDCFEIATWVLRPGSPLYIAYADGNRMIFEQALRDAGWLLRQNLIWVKDTMVLGHGDYHYRHEPILYGFTPGGKGRRGRGGKAWFGNHSQTSVFEIPRPTRSKEHPTMKPVALVAAMIANSAPRGGIVYDPFGGSGTTLLACHRLARTARLCELDPRYADVICTRFERYAGVKPERVGPGGSTEIVSFVTDTKAA